MFRRGSWLAIVLLLTLAPAVRAEDPPRRLLLIRQSKDNHPPETHEYMAGVRLMETLMAEFEQIETTLVQADGPWEEAPELLAKADGAVLFVSEGAKWISAEPRRLDAFAGLASRGGGLVVLHWGMGTKEAGPIENFVKLFGGCHGGPDRRYKVLETELRAAGEHPATVGIEPFRLKDEFYYKLKFASEPRPVPLITAEIEGEAEPVAWAWERTDGGRSLGFSGLHFHANWERPEYRRLVLQGVLWSLKLPVPEKGIDLPAEAASAAP